MAIRYDDGTARLEGTCGVEEALPLAEWLAATPGGAVDLAGCTGLHTAVLQVLLAARPVLAAAPGDPFLARWVGPLLQP